MAYLKLQNWKGAWKEAVFETLPCIRQGVAGEDGGDRALVLDMPLLLDYTIQTKIRWNPTSE